MAFLRDEELQSLRIANMSLHVVREGEFTPQPNRAVEHEEFFVERVRDTDVAPVFSFQPQSFVKSNIGLIARGEQTFEAGSQALAREFSRFHHGAHRPGAFFIFELTSNDSSSKLYSLIKYDYQEVIEQADQDGGNLLRLILQAFVAEKRAIQKSAFVRVSNGQVEESLCARDRMKQAPDIGDYFADYLDVQRARSDEELNRAVRSVLQQTLTESRDVLPDRDVARAFQRAQSILRDRQQIDDQAVTDAVLAAAGSPEDETVRSQLEARARRKMKSAKLDGLAFRPDLGVLQRPVLRRVRTTEGITITYPDQAGSNTVSRIRTENGGEIITINTRQVTEDRVVSDSARIQAG